MTCKRTVLIAGGPNTLVDELRALRPHWLILDCVEDPRLIGHATVDLAGNHEAGKLSGGDRAGSDRAGGDRAGGDRAAIVFGFIHWLLPRMAGIEACRRLRTLVGAGAQTGIGTHSGSGPGRLHLTMVLESDAPADRMRAIDAGADDYMPAPLTASAIVARIAEAPSSGDAPFGNHQRSGRTVRVRATDGLLHQGDLLVDPQAFHVLHKSRIVPLSRGEFAMLVYFMQRPNRVISREALAEQTGKVGMIQARTIDRSVARLRKALESHAVPAPIRTVYGLGYVFDAID